MPKIRVGIFVDTPHIPMWAYKMLERIQAGNYASIEIIVQGDVIEAEAPNSRTHWRDLLSRNVRKVLRRLESWLMDRVECVPDALEHREIINLLSEVPIANVSPIGTTLSQGIGDEDIDRLRPFGIDVLVCLGNRPLSGRILNLPKFGVWSYHHGDIRVKRGGAQGFWETMQGWPETVSELQILTENPDDCRILYRSWSRTADASIKENRNNIYWKSLSFLPRKLEELFLYGEKEFFSKIQKLNSHPVSGSDSQFSHPTNAQLAKLLSKKLLKKVASKIRNRIYFDQWILMFDIGPEMSTNPSRFQTIVPPKDRFWADPHHLHKDGKYYIFFEEYLNELGRGHISLIVMDSKGNYEEPVTVLSRPYHLSYPFIFEWRDELYMMPESIANQTIEIYKCVDFPFAWEFEKNIMEDVNVVDATLFRRDDMWWLFANMVENKGAPFDDELFLFHSESPLSDEWTPHPCNPLISDVRKSRPAGRIFERNGNLYRPSQRGSPRYGYGFNLNEIVQWTQTEYEEKRVVFVEPKWDKKISCTHTFNYGDGLTTIDAKLRRRK